MPINVCFPYVGRELGGSHISSLGLIQNLDRSRYLPTVLLQYLDGPVFELFKDHTIDVKLAPQSAALPFTKTFNVFSTFQATSSSYALSRFLNRNNFAIVHTNDGRTHATWAPPTKLAGRKLCWHHRGNPDARGLRFVAPFLADCVVSVSKFASPKPAVISAASKNHVVHSPFNIEIEEDANAARQQIIADLNCDPSAKFVGYFGAFIERKRPVLFVDAIAEAIKAAPATKIYGLMFGEAYDTGERVLQRAKDLGIEENIKLMGFRSPGSFWLAGCDAMLVPAINEPFGRTLIEAMLVGTPIIAADSGGTPEAIRHNETGLLTEPDNPVALGAETANVLTNPELKSRLISAAKIDARGRFGEKHHADAIMNLYDNLLGK